MKENMLKPVFIYVRSLLCLAGLFMQTAHSAPIVPVSRFGVAANTGADATPGVMAALKYCSQIKAAKLVFGKGRYDFWPDRAQEAYLFTSNNDEGLKRIVFKLAGLHNFEIDGQGANFIFHGFISPFVIGRCTNISLKGFSVDWDRTFDSEGRILAVYKDSIDVSFGKEYPYTIQDHLLIFKGTGKSLYPYSSLLEFDPVKKETAYMAHDYYTGPNIPVKDLGPGKVRLFVPDIKGIPGNIMVFGAAQRFCPAIAITDSKGINLSFITIYHAGGMGVIAQRSSNLWLNEFNVTTPPNSQRMVSATADATHFANCSGKISITHCLFEHQEDDATNIHGIYVQVTKILSGNTLEVQLKHEQQLGFDFLKKGMAIEFVNAKSLVTYRTAIIASVKRLNKEYNVITCTKAFTTAVHPGDVVAANNAYPDVVIKDCTIQKNRARGLLLGSRGTILIEGNFFHTPGAAILLEGNAEYWFEQAGVRHLTIRNNVFSDCNYGVWGNAVIQVGAGIAPGYRGNSRYNRNITISSNEFRQFDPRILNIYSVDELTFINNKIVKTNNYPATYPAEKPFIAEQSDNIVIK